MSRIPSHVRLLKDRWSYRLEVSAETLKAFNGRLDERVLRADAACRLREFADCTESVSLPPGVIVAEPDRSRRRHQRARLRPSRWGEARRR